MLTPVNFGLLTDVMAALPSGSGLSVGMVQQIPNTTEFAVLVKNGAVDLPIGAALKLHGTTEDYVVDVTTNLGEIASYFNSLAGIVIPATYYFWAGVKGYQSLLVATGTSAGDLLVPSAADGVLTTFDISSPPQQQSNILLVAGNSSGAEALRLCLVS